MRDHVKAILDVRTRRPQAIAQAAAQRKRRAALLSADNQLFIIAADHTARGMVALGDDLLAMANRRVMLERLLTALEHPRVDGVLASADIMDDLVLLGALDDRVAVGTMNRGGLAGASWELDDRFTAYDTAHLIAANLDAGKMLLRIDEADAGTVSAGAFEDWLERVELGDLTADLPGDHRREELHRTGGVQVQGEPYDCGTWGCLGELEHPGGPRWPGGDLEFQPGRRVEDGDLVVAVDPAAARAGQDLAVGRSLAAASGGPLDFQDAGAPFGVVGAVGEIVEYCACWPVDGDGALGVRHGSVSLSSSSVSWQAAAWRRQVTGVPSRRSHRR